MGQSTGIFWRPGTGRNPNYFEVTDVSQVVVVLSLIAIFPILCIADVWLVLFERCLGSRAPRSRVAALVASILSLLLLILSKLLRSFFEGRATKTTNVDCTAGESALLCAYVCIDTTLFVSLESMVVSAGMLLCKIVALICAVSHVLARALSFIVALIFHHALLSNCVVVFPCFFAICPSGTFFSGIVSLG